MQHPWNLTPTEAVALQRELAARVVPQPPAGFAPRLVAGADLSMDRFASRGFAGIVVLDTTTMETVDEASEEVPLSFPYIPGLLSFRELPAILAVWERLRVRPDALVIDGQGYAHPRRFGIACHAGVLLELPTVACAKSLLVGTPGALGSERGATAPLVHRGEVVGMAVRTRDRVQPVYVSVGHLVDLPTAVELVLALCVGFREPETTRRAHRLVNARRLEARRGGEA
jgi:deoxyribonuclease V